MCVPLHTGGPGLSVVVNAAGITRDKTLLKMSEEAFDEVVKVNLKVHTIHLKLGCMSGNMVGDWQLTLVCGIETLFLIHCVHCFVRSLSLSGNIPGVSGCCQTHGGEQSDKWLHCQHCQHHWEGTYK